MPLQNTPTLRTQSRHTECADYFANLREASPTPMSLIHSKA